MYIYHRGNSVHYVCISEACLSSNVSLDVLLRLRLLYSASSEWLLLHQHRKATLLRMANERTKRNFLSLAVEAHLLLTYSIFYLRFR